MVVSGLKNSCFCADYGSVVVSDVAGNLSIVLLADGASVLEEVYSPNKKNEVVIRNLGDVLQAYFESVENPTLDNSTRKLQMSVTITLNDGTSFTHNQRVFYSTISTGISVDITYIPFLTRYKKKKTTASRRELLNMYNNRQTVWIGVAYLLNDATHFEKFEYYRCTDTHDGLSLDVSIRKVVDFLSTHNLQLKSDDIIYYEAYAVVDGIVKDETRFVNDKRVFHQETHFLYFNCFGLPETITFTGQDNRKIDPGITYGYLLDNYRQIESLPIVSNQVYSGHISREVAECIEELLISDRKYLYADDRIGKEIVITEVGMEQDSASNRPISYSLTYRPAALRHLEYKRIIYDTGRVFDKTFDDTFD